jgi:hypothetical protein
MKNTGTKSETLSILDPSPTVDALGIPCTDKVKKIANGFVIEEYFSME